MTRTRYLLAGLGLILIGGLVGKWTHKPEPTDAQSKGVQTLRSAYETIRTSYVEPLSADSLVRASISGMTESLDPFSVYISADRMTQVKESFRGSFEGIGISYELIDGPRNKDTIAVVSVVEEGPSAEAGLRAGDRIVEVNDTSAVGWPHEKIQRRLKGPQGSRVNVTLRRPGADAPVQTTITRDTVPLETVPATYMIEDRTGYIRLERFAEPTHREVTDALDRLEDEGMERLVLDLRGNSGGLMSMAEKVADAFLVDDQLIVEARSRHEGYGGARYATTEGRFERKPVIVLVDERSASASEIVAGALQDHDRALIMGRRTFGKGLIQRQFGLGDGSTLRLTVARFYTPSGRLLQRPHGQDRDSLSTTDRDPSEVVDSLVHRTDAGRPVIGGGGIQPDRVVTAPDRSPYWTAVSSADLLRSFARQWTDARADSLRRRWGGREEAFVYDFALPDSTYDAFVQAAAARGVSEADSTGGSASDFTTAEISAARPAVEATIKAYVGQRLFGEDMRRRIQNRSDPVVQQALQSWDTARAWAERYPIK
ncbi:MAG: S41 family peptidase [Bacteroidetes bacterium SW_9_63_38]|nr:MAG: S41 family peptidase [Bacteroidetes bacterium SW_9_63_38]